MIHGLIVLSLVDQETGQLITPLPVCLRVALNPNIDNGVIRLFTISIPAMHSSSPILFGQMNSCTDKVQIQNKVDSVNGASHTVLMCMNNSLRAEDDPGRAVSSARVPSKILERQM